jgi:hypothetical protein
MIPTHQHLVDLVLTRMARRVSELTHHCLPASRKPPAEPTIEQLRETPFGIHLAAIAHYAEGYAYPLEGDVRNSMSFVARCLFGDPLTQQGFRLPPKWQRDPLGKLVHTALLRFFEEERPGKLLTVTDIRKLFDVKRQTVHQWVEDGLLFAVYRGDTPLFYQNDVVRFQQARARKQE